MLPIRFFKMPSPHFLLPLHSKFKTQEMDRLRFISFASGSNGNCFFVGNASQGILIDAGIGIRTMKKRLKEIGMDFSDILGVFITHDHFDHIKSVKPLVEKMLVPIYGTKETLSSITQLQQMGEQFQAGQRVISKEEPVIIGDWRVTAFEVSHDGTDNVGYCVEYKDKVFTLATDLGYVCENSARHIAEANYLVLEANYDEEMLANGPYPYMLQERIRSNTGHLSNSDAGRFLADNYSEKLEYIYLCHLSHSNNLPELAYCTVSELLSDKGIIIGKDVELVTLERTSPSKLYVFD
ncbi:MAG: metallo-beta-lactamase superfamily hydrolase [Bacteroidetes bacterium]|jgi:phosphoribosyl 1,2-cyclic phosphodiesterase|nr:metallo-beta-lactamase superfamily hydrolase [Bacteroidota bacterium]